LAEIELRTGIVRATGRSYRFDQYQIHELVLGKLSEVLLEEYHTLLAESFAAREGVGEEVEGAAAVFLAWHHLHGSEPRAGLVFRKAAVRRLLQGGRVEDALQLVDRALESPGLLEGEERCRALTGQARRWHRLARREEERDLASRATKRADELGDASLRVESRLRLAESYENTPEAEAGVHPLEEALQIAREAEDREWEAVILKELASHHWNVRSYGEAHEYARLALAASEALDRNDPAPLLVLGIILHNLGRYAEARENYAKSLRLHRENGTVWGQVTSLGNIALIHSVLGDFERARRDFEESLTLSEGLASRSNEGYLLHELGELAEREMRTDDAKRHYAAAVRKWREAGRPDDVGLTLVARGRLALSEGDRETARASLEEALQLAAEFKHPGACVLGAVYQASLPDGDPATALAVLAEYEDRCRHREKIEARHVLYKLTRDRAHLAIAGELLEYLREHAPEELRDSMPNNPLFRAIFRACEETHATRDAND
jgi:tetratricopeptide (TPR) repeat protein